MIALVVTLGILAITGAVRGFRARHTEARSKRRLPADVNGIVIGAESLALSGTVLPAILLIHGFGDTPQSVAELAAFLNRSGHSVTVPLLPGHGRDLRSFAASRADQWIGAARAAYVESKDNHTRVAIVGLSMGGAIAAVLAAEMPPDSLVLLAPYLGVPQGIRTMTRGHRIASLLSEYWSSGGAGSIHDPVERDEGLAYGIFTPRLIRELLRVVDQATSSLPDLRAPTLVIQSRFDNRVSTTVTARAFDRIGASRKSLHWTTVGGHVITVDYGKEAVFKMVAAWIGGPPEGASRSDR
ncbi:MAG: alpha/beta fold hydrolase [Chloroflexota bacterium]